MISKPGYRNKITILHVFLDMAAIAYLMKIQGASFLMFFNRMISLSKRLSRLYSKRSTLS